MTAGLVVGLGWLAACATDEEPVGTVSAPVLTCFADDSLCDAGAPGDASTEADADAAATSPF